VTSEKFGEVRLPGQEQNREVAAVDDVAAKRAQLFDEPAEIWVEFGSATGDVHDGYVRFREGLDASFGGFARHDFAAGRAGIHMTVAAGLIAELADVDLEDGDACGRQREEASLGELFLERRRTATRA
jgi:hypothetical protein